jgi:hypothetical protein
MDGGFTMYNHPRCAYSAGLPLQLDLLLNILNINLNADQLQRMWDAGQTFGF